MYYLIWDVGGPTDARVYKIEPRAPTEWRASTPLPSALPRVAITVNRLVYVGDLRRAESDYLIGSMQVLSILHSLRDVCFEDYAVELVDFRSGERDVQSFRVLRLLGDVACLDVDETAWVTDELGRSTRTKPVRFDESKVPINRHLFWMRERPAVLVCSDEFKKRWDDLELKGPAFDPLEGPLKGW